MQLNKAIIYELLLVFASVLIFRGFWMILDRISLMNHDLGIIGSLIVGIIITLLSLIKLNKIIDEKKEK